MKWRKPREERISYEDLIALLGEAYSKLDDEMLLHTTRCAAHLLAVRMEITPRSVFDMLFQSEQEDAEWREFMIRMDSSRVEA